MSHPLSQYCSELLRMGWHRLGPRERRVRVGVEDFLSNLRNGGARDVVRRLRRLSLFMRLNREHWPYAIDRLFAMKYVDAESLITRYRQWIERKKWSPYLRTHMNAWGFVRLSRYLKRRGTISWELKHVFTQAREARWAACTASFRSKVEEWLRIQAARNLRPASIERLREDLFLMGSWMRTRGLSFLEAERADALSWLEGLRAKNLSASTNNHRLSAAKRFYEWLVLENLIKRSPFELIGFQAVPRRLPKFLEEHEVSNFIRAAKSGCDRAVLEVIYSSGCRSAELCNMSLSKLSRTAKTVMSIGKGGHDRILYLNNSALKALESWMPERQRYVVKTLPPDRDALFLTSAGTRLNTEYIRSIVRRTLISSRLEKHVSPHMLRHAFASHMLNRGADIYSIMQFMGHKNIQSTVRYLQIATGKLSEIHQRFHPRK